MDKQHNKFDENGMRIPRITKEESRQKIEQTQMEIIQENRAQSMAENIAQCCAIMKYQKPEAYNLIKAKVSPKLEKMIEAKYSILVPLVEAGIYKIDNEEVVKTIEQVLKILEAGI